MEFHQTWLEEAINWLDFEWDWGGGVWCEPPSPPPPPSDFVYLCNNSSITSWNFIRLGGKVKYDVAINWLDFEWDYIAGGDQIWNVLVLLWILQERIETNYYIKDLGNNAVCERAEAYQSTARSQIFLVFNHSIFWENFPLPKFCQWFMYPPKFCQWFMYLIWLLNEF